MTNQTSIAKTFLDTFYPDINLTAKWEDWVDGLVDERLTYIIHKYDDPVQSGNLGVYEEYQGQMVVELMIIAENALDFVKMYTTVFYGFAIQAAVENDVAQDMVSDMVRNSKYLATMIWNTSHGLTKELLQQSLPAIVDSIVQVLGEKEGKQFVDKMEWHQIKSNIYDIEIV